MRGGRARCVPPCRLPRRGSTAVRGSKSQLHRTLARLTIGLGACALLPWSGAVKAQFPINPKQGGNPRPTDPFVGFPFPGGAHSFFVNTLERVSRITIPTLVLWGEEDQLDSPETARLLYNALLCKKRLHIIPGNGHVGHLDRNRAKVFALTADWALENLAA